MSAQVIPFRPRPAAMAAVSAAAGDPDEAPCPATALARFALTAYAAGLVVWLAWLDLACPRRPRR